jgi:hypothetical protein
MRLFGRKSLRLLIALIRQYRSSKVMTPFRSRGLPKLTFVNASRGQYDNVCFLVGVLLLGDIKDVVSCFNSSRLCKSPLF